MKQNNFFRSRGIYPLLTALAVIAIAILSMRQPKAKVSAKGRETANTAAQTRSEKQNMAAAGGESLPSVSGHNTHLLPAKTPAAVTEPVQGREVKNDEAAKPGPLKEITRQQIAALMAEKEARTPAQVKMDSALIYLVKQTRGEKIADVPTLQMDVRPDPQGLVEVDMTGTVSAELLVAIRSGGGVVINHFASERAIRAKLPVASMEALAARNDVQFIRPADRMTTNLGSVVSEGDRTHRADSARTTFGATGSGVKIGVLSDGVTSLAASVANGNLKPVTVLPGQTGSGDEGTAMLEIVQDLAPDAQLYFASAFGSAAQFAQNIRDLAAAGCTVIVDDVSYYSESPFQNAVVAKAVDDVSAAGVLYFSSAGNSGNKDIGTSGTWEGDFVSGGTATVGSKAAQVLDFGGGVTSNIVNSGGSSYRVDLFWADPLGASTNDYDFFVVDSTGAVLRSSTTVQNGTQDPYESSSTLNAGERIVVVKATTAASRFVHLDTGRGRLAISTAGKVRGHNGSPAANAFSVAAVAVSTAPSPNVFTGGAANAPETFTTDGPRRMFYAPDGTPYTAGNFSSTGGQVFNKPDIAAADGVTTSVSGFNPFYGTSAAAPHAAAIAGLIKSYNPALTPAQVRTLMQTTALDISTAGYDRNTGSGITMAFPAIQAAPAPDSLTISGGDISASGTFGGPFTPTSGSYVLKNNGASDLTWSASSTQQWTTLSSNGGTLTAGASVTVTWSLSATATGVPTGTSTDTLTIVNSTTGYVQRRLFTLTVTPPVFYSANMNSDPGWTRTGEWAYGVPLGGGGTSFGNHDPTSGATGTSVIGINLSGDYSTVTGAANYATAGPFNLTNRGGTQLRFKRWLNSDYQPYVYATIEVSNNGSTWTSVYSNGSTEVADSSWQTLTYDISAVADGKSAVYVRWGHQVSSSGAYAYSGWNIDDVEILATAQASLTLAVNPSAVTEGGGTATATLTASPAPSSDTVVTLLSSNTAAATVPASVTILAGQTSATFPVSVIDDAVLNGSRAVLLTASASSYANGSTTLTVNDNETATLTVAAPASATEGVGSVQGTVTLSAAPVTPVSVSLSSSDASAATVPTTVLIAAGQTTANFAIAIVDDSKIDGTQNATITASVANWTSGTASIAVLDNETTALGLVLPATVTEAGTGIATVSISGTLTTNLTVALASDTPARLTVPATVTILAGSTSASFTLSAPNNALTDGSSTVGITASTAGFTTANGTTTVLDNDLHHYAIGAIATSQTRGVPFSVTITALDVNNVILSSYTAAATLSASGAGGLVSITPTTTTAFAGGVWSGSLTVNSLDTNVVLTASDGAGHAGTSNPFTVGIGALHHFAWNSQTTRARNASVSATITAQDAGNNTVTAFTGTVNLSGSASNTAGSSVVITEINPNTPDEIEFMNVSSSPVDVSGWTIYFYDYDTGGSSYKSYVIPAGSICAAGQIFRLQENTGTSVFPLFYYGANINWTSDSSTNVGVLIRDASNNIVDFVCAGGLTPSAITTPLTIPTSQWSGLQVAGPTDTTYGYLRIGSSDANSATNWTTGTPTIGVANTGLTVPFPSSQMTVAVTPATSGSFSGGLWTGSMTVSQPAIQMKFTADDGSGHTGSSNAFDVTGTLALSIPTSVLENGVAVTGTVTVSAAPATDLVVSLSSSDLTAITVPATVTIPAGQTSATFQLTPVDDSVVDGTQVATITAHLSNWTDATTTINVIDNETLSLALFLPGSVTEGSTATATVSTSGTVPSNLTVSLVSNTTSRLTVPATVTIPSGSSSVTFTVTAVDNALTDGSATVNIAASAAGYTGTNANITVQDNDFHHFTIGTIAASQTKGLPFNVSITANEIGGSVVTSYNGTPGLTASGTTGANVISPTNASGFVSGVWSGQVTSFNSDTNVVITVNDGAGHTATSNAFSVVNPTFSPYVVETVTPATLQPGNAPRSQLVTGADGNFYGTTTLGGSSNAGTIFKMTAAGVMTTLVNFYGANGAQPYAGLILGSDGNFYGTTSIGGSSGNGTIFKMTPSGVLTTLVHLTGTASVPKSPLLQASDGNFYGTTTTGGAGGFGSIFKMTSSGVFTILVNFTGTVNTAYGSTCLSGLIQGSDGNLYGVTSAGGSSSLGTIFKVTTDGTFTNLANFTGTTGATLGSAPSAALVQASDGNLYGTTSTGGTGGFGTVFKVTTAGVFTNLLSFTGTTGSFLGNSPQAALVQWATDGSLYGTTNTGGSNSVGTLFKVTTAGALTTLRTFSNSSDGANPFGALMLAGNGTFYGQATNGGSWLRGTVFSLVPSTGTFARVFSHANSPPIFKQLLQATDGNFYGTTAYGNSSTNSVFKLTPAGVLTSVANFTSTSSVAPFLIQGSDGSLYGAAPAESSYGQLFSISLAGTKNTLATFTNSSGAVLGSNVVGGLVQGSDGLIYGTTSAGGASLFGTVWKISTAGTFTSLTSFTGSTGAALGTAPQSRMVQGSDGNFYGTTQTGGTSNLGSVFKITPAGVLTTLVSFTGTTGASPGTNPNSTLLLASDGNFYGTTNSGGTGGGYGTIYKVAADGTFTSLVSFTNTSGANLGSTPTTNLIQGADGNFYGTTSAGGANGFGTVYKVTPAGALTTLVSFTGTGGVAPGSSPTGTLKQGSDGCFYGTTNGGGLYGLGTVFRISSSGVFQSLYTFGTSNDGGSPNISGSSLYPDSYRLITGTDGYLYGVNASSVFKVHQQPLTQTIAATSITPGGATLTASVIPNPDGTSAYYQYGFSTAYGSQTTTQNLAGGLAAVPVNATLSGLLPGVVYHYRLVTVTPQGTYTTADQTFATTSAPQVITGSFVNAAQTGFALNGMVNPFGSNTTYYYEYGLDTTYGTQTTTQSAGSGLANVLVNTTVNSLTPGTTYHVRLVATNSVGTAYGDDQVIKTFPSATTTVQPVSQYVNTGTAPLAGLLKGTDGNFYGTLSTGGTFGSAGSVYRLSPGGTLTTLANFYNNTNATLSGNNPQSSLVQAADGNFYGTTNSGGANGLGCIFKMTPAGQVTVMVSFNSASTPLGSNPICGLTLGNDGNFYGVAQNGGSSSLGTVFKITPAGVFTTLLSFTGTTGAYLGSNPRASLTLGSDGNFYGTTATGGTGGFGTIFKVTPAGVFTTLVQFTGTTGSYLGSTPLGALVQGADGSLYGTTSVGGVNNVGTVFKITTTATFTTLTNFTGSSGSVLGSTPKGALIQLADGSFYGTTTLGGTSSLGTVFSITSAGVLTTLVNFTGSTGAVLGATPQGALVTGTDGALYGTTNTGGLNNVGSIFKVTSTGLFTHLVSLTAAPGVGRLVQGETGNIYGATLGGGGATGYGTLFAAPPTGAPNTLSTLAPVSGTTALNARAGLLWGPDGSYYGTTNAGGTGSGSVFKLTPAGVYTSLISFTGSTGANPGSSPQAALVTGSDGNFYGTTSGGGTSSLGTIYKMTPAGVLTTLINFTGTSGANLGSSPQAPLTLATDGNYYGTTTTGGGGFGTIYKMTPAGVLTTLVSFTGTAGAALGSSPLGVLAQGADGNFYGVTSTGGASNVGTVFKMTPAGVFTSLASFTGTTGALLGSTPTGGLFAGRDGCLYGVTSAGGLYSQGVLFRVATDGSVTTLASFSGRGEGLTPNNGLVLAADNYLYGGDASVIYRVNPPPVALAAPATDLTSTTATLNGSITGNAYSGTARIEYGLTTTYGTVASTTDFTPGFTSTALSTGVSGLQPFETYHYRVVASTSYGDFASQDQTISTPNTGTFNTPADVPVIANGFTANGLPFGISLGFAPVPGTVLTLVNNTGFSSILGIFNGLPNGAVVAATYGGQSYQFVINYAGGDGNDITLTAVTQSITFPAIPAKLTTSGPFTLAGTATSGLPVSYSITSGSASASLSDSTVTLTGVAGPVTITATQAGNGGSYGAALPVTQTFVVLSGSPFTKISCSKGTNFTLGVRADGTLWAWGYNVNNNLGNGSTSNVWVPQQIGTATNWKSVSAGGNHALAVKTDGTLWAWGYNLYGQLGDGSTTTRSSPVQVGTATNWSAVAAGYYHSVALKSDGTLWAWGYNADGENGQGTSDSGTTHTSPAQIGSVTTWNSIVSGSYHILAQRSDGSLWAWGHNSYGQVGNASTSTVTAPVQIGTATTWNSLSCGYYSSMGTRSDGTLWTWGRNLEGQLGDGGLTQRTSPGQVGTDTNWQQAQAGSYHMLAKKSDGTLWAWGLNSYGQLGLGYNDQTLRGNTPVQIGAATNWSVLAPGNSFNLATRSDGTLWSWGDNGSGGLGYGGHVLQPVCAQLGSMLTASSGDGHAALIRADGTLWALGNNGSGQLGTGSTDSVQHPALSQIQPGTQWISQSTGGFHTAAVRSDGTLWTWGYNNNGQLGDGTTTTRSSPIQVGTDANWAQVSSGYYFTVGMRTDGTLWAWGYNTDGQMGNGTTSSSGQWTPVQVGSGNDWSSVACGFYHVLALKQNGTLWAWGSNSAGGLGDGSTTSRSTPVQVGSATSWHSISAGKEYSAAIQKDGTLWSWGSNAYGALGDGTFTDRSSPAKVGTDTTWASVSAGYFHAYATKLDGSLWAWGNNYYYQLGNGSNTTVSSPVQVGKANGWSQVFHSGSNSFVSAIDGSLWACGYTNRGATGYAWRNQWVPDLVLPALSPPQTLSFPAVTNTAVGSTVTLAATSSSGLPVSYIVSGPATLNGSRITVNAPGLITLFAWQPGDSFYQSSDMALQYLNAPAPAADTLPATAVTTTTATLNGSVNPNGSASVVSFQSGSTTAYGTTTAVTLTPNNGTDPQTVSTTLSGLTPGTTYHFRVTTTNAGGVTNGDDVTFTTLTANLSALALSSGSLAPSFDPTVYSYAAAVDVSVSSLSVTPTTADSNATVSVNGMPVISGSASSPISLGYGINTINVVVTASDNLSTQSYAVVVTRDIPNPLPASYSTGTEVPVTANGFTATGSTVNLALNYAPLPGSRLTVINNTGLGPISGTFSNLTHGQTVGLSYNGMTYKFLASYYGGTGNDLVLMWAGTRPVAWGYNTSGELGNGNTTDSSVPISVTLASTPLANRSLLALTAGYQHSLALCSDGTMASWGYNLYGQLGNNTTTNGSLPVAVTTAGTPLAGKGIAAVSAGHLHNLVLCTDGTLASWGYNLYGQLGNNTTTNSSLPVAVTTTGTPLASKSVGTIGTGTYHNLVLCSDGTIATWGYNTYGQLGNNTTTNSSLPVAVTTAGTPLAGRSVVSVSAGGYHNLALCSDGTIVTWGYNFYGQLGNGTTTNSSVPIAVPTTGTVLAGKTVVAVVAGHYHSMALCSDGTIATWGYNNNGQLGNNSTTQSNVPVAVINTGVLAGKTVTGLYSGYYHCMATCSDGTVVAWGYNSNGQLGNNSTTQSNVPVAVSTAPLAAGEVFMQVSAGQSAYHNLALVASPVPAVTTLAATSVTATTAVLNGTVNANGGTAKVSFDYGLSTSYGINVAGTPATVTSSSDTAVSTSVTGLMPNTTYHFRANASASYNGADLSFTTPNNNASLSGLALSAGTLTPAFASATTSYTASVSDVTTSITFTPTTADSQATVIVNGSAVTSGSASSPIALTYGANTVSVIVTAADNVTTQTYAVIVTRPIPNPLTATYASSTDVPLTVNGLTATGGTVNFALNYAPVPGTQLTVVKNTGLGFISGTFSNLSHGQTVGLSYNGVTYKFVANYYGGTGNDLVLMWAGTRPIAWGDNSYGQLGKNASGTGLVPVAVVTAGTPLAGRTVLALSSGSYHSLALCSDGSIASWGGNSDGELGNNTTTGTLLPVAVTTAGTPLAGKVVCAVSAGYACSLALCTDGTLAAWGYNGSGELGNGSSTSSKVPVAVTKTDTPLSGKSVVSIGTGEYHNLALCSDGSIAAWGANFWGMLGNNTTTDSYVPTAVTTVGTPLAGKTIISVAAGGFHNLALCSDGTLVAWGANTYGALGNNTTTNSLVPVAVTTAGTALAGKKVVAVSAGNYHSAALCSDGTIVTWGYNSWGQLGINTTTNSLVPVAVPTAGTALAGKTVVTLTAGYYFTTATCSDGTVATWGQNSYANLGNNSTTQSNVPVAVNTGLLVAGERFMPDTGSQRANHHLSLVATPAPAATTLAAASVTTNSAVLNGTVNANGGTAAVSFDYGLDTSYGINVAASPASATGSSSTAASVSLTSLTPGTTYHFRVNSADTSGTANGADMTFTTTDTNAYLSALAVSGGVFTPAFGSVGLTYAVGVPNATASFTVTPVAASSSATITVNGTAVASGAASSSITLSGDSMTVNVVVTAQDGSTTQTYVLNMSRNTVYQDWAIANNLGSASNNPSNDSDGDGVSDMLEYAFGSSPTAASKNILPVAGNNLNPADGKHYLTYAYRRRIAPGGMTYSIETSASLTGWTAVSAQNLEQVGSAAPTGDGVTEIVTFRLLPAIETAPAARFVRLKVTP